MTPLADAVALPPPASRAGGHERPATARDAACTHCGLPVPAGLVVPDESRQFCCGGCRAVWQILHEHGLEGYYRVANRRAAPPRVSGRDFEEFDHPAFHRLYVRPAGAGLSTVELYLEGVHCSACVWLVERVPLVVPGVVRAELDVTRARAQVTWDPATVSLGAVARTLDSLGYRPHPFRGLRGDAVRRDEDRAMLVRIGIAGAIALNVMLAALALYSGWLSTGGMEHEFERYFRWISLALTTPAMLGPGRVFFRGAWASLRTRTLHMDVPIAIALAAGFTRGAINTVTDAGPIYFDGVTMLIFLLLSGRFLQQRGQRAATDAAELMFSLTPATGRIVESDDSQVVREVPAEALVPGMVLDVRPGETLAADGVVVAGETSLDLSLLTGESRPSSGTLGSRVFAGTINLTGPVRVRIEQAGESSRLGRMMRQVEEGARRRAPMVLLADRLAGWFVGGVLLLAAATFVLWLRLDPSRAADNAIALLIVTCPCALALATPLAVTAAVGRAARSGILIKGGDALERLARPGRLLLDKTGTLTEGRSALVEWVGPDWVKPLVVSLERNSTHALAAGFLRAWPDLEALPVDGAEHTLGGGISGTVAGRRVLVGSPAFVRRRLGAGADDGAMPYDSRSWTAALTPVVVAVDGVPVATAGFGDPLRPGARAALDRLRAGGWRVGILSGDDPAVVAEAGRQLGISPDECVGGATPEEKLRVVSEASRAGPVVMVGDGVNDAAALAAAGVGVGVHGGAEAALAAADVWLARGGVEELVRLMDGSRRTLRLIRRTIAFSLVYNLVGGTLAVAGVINPLIAALLMPASSLTVVMACWRGTTFTDERAA
jgi:Cu2+-exporting ATPase